MRKRRNLVTLLWVDLNVEARMREVKKMLLTAVKEEERKIKEMEKEKEEEQEEEEEEEEERGVRRQLVSFLIRAMR